MPRPRHPDKHVESAVQYAESLGWEVRLSQGHAWGHLLCPQKTRDGCRIPVWSTPRVPLNHARHIRREVDRCPHRGHVDGANEDKNADDEDEYNRP